MRFIFLLFIAMPIVEMLVLIKVGSMIGAWYTVGLVLLTAIIGVNLLKRQGLSTLFRAQQKAQAGALPISEIGEGLLLAVAGALLLTPGFVTDAVGFALLSPQMRSKLAKSVAQRLVQTGSSNFQYSNTTYKNGFAEDESIIDGDYTEVDEQSARAKDNLPPR